MNKGDIAPEFELKDADEKSVKLSDFKGKKVLLAFFPFAFSPVCTDEMSCFEDDLGKFQDKGFSVLAISVDSTWTNKAFSDKLGLKFPLLSDFDKEVAKSYGVLRDQGFSERAYFFISEDGKIDSVKIMDNPGKMMDNEELLAMM